MFLPMETICKEGSTEVALQYILMTGNLITRGNTESFLIKMQIDGETTERRISVCNFADFLPYYIFSIKNFSTSILKNFHDS